MADSNTNGTTGTESTGSAGSTTTSTATTTTTPPDWTTGFSDEVKSYVANKGFKSPSDVLDSYRNFEKLQGVPQDRILKLPEKMDSDEGKQMWKRLGMPEKPEDYQLEVSEQTGNKDQMEVFAKAFHDAAIPKDAAKKIVDKLKEYQTAVSKDAVEAAKAREADQQRALQKDWGSAVEQNTNIAKEAARILGVEKGQIDALASVLGHDGAMKLFHKIGGAVREDLFVAGRTANSIKAPDIAKGEIEGLKKDMDFIARFSKGETEAVTKWNRLHQQAYPGEQSI